MTLFGSLRTGVTGLLAQGQSLSAASDNIANANTVGYKATRARFSTFVTTQSVANAFAPGGVSSHIRRDIDVQGLLQSTTVATDLAISGKGFFTVTDQLTRNASTGIYEITGNVTYTRAGEFRTDANGNLLNSQGFFLVGLPANATNTGFAETNVNANFVGINVGTQSTVPVPTTSVEVSANLTATSDASTTSGFQPYSITTQLFDRQGTQRSLRLDYYKEGTNNQTDVWLVRGQVIDNDRTASSAQPSRGGILTRAIVTAGAAPSEDVVTNRDPNNPTLGVPLGFVTFDANGTPNSFLPYDIATITTLNTQLQGGLANTPVGATPAFHTIPVPTTGAFLGTTGANAGVNSDNRFVIRVSNDNNQDLPLTTAIGAVGGGTVIRETTPAQLDDNSTITLNFGTVGLIDGLTQFNGQNTLNFLNQNGRQFGTLTGASVNQSGIVSAVFNNGATSQIYRIPITTFNNPNGLTPNTGNVYRESSTSGQAVATTAGLGGTGQVSGSTLENSTVDLTEEFTQLIISQRSYSANTRSITTADQLLQELVQLVR